MSSRTAARFALALQALYVALTFGWRSWLHYRSTGDTGFRLGPKTPFAARVASGLMVGGAATGLVGTATAARAGSRVAPRRFVALIGIICGLLGTYRAQLDDMGQIGRLR